ncbi:hypothetical protein BGX24_000643 [Mortierella sp. AD032]|nr:hypothetical protein BGX24_000643 [Mortierella sp. AD032]
MSAIIALVGVFITLFERRFEYGSQIMVYEALLNITTSAASRPHPVQSPESKRTTHVGLERVFSNKSRLRKLVIYHQCVFEHQEAEEAEDRESEDNRKGTVTETSTKLQQA